MKNITKAAFAAMLAVGGLSVAATSASAAIVCNDAGDCWHVKDHYDYPASYGVVVHDDNWKCLRNTTCRISGTAAIRICAPARSTASWIEKKAAPKDRLCSLFSVHCSL